MKRWYIVIAVMACVFMCALTVFGQAPPAPANLAAHQGIGASVVLGWDAASGAQFYAVYKSVDGSEFISIAATERLSYIDWLLSRNHDIRYFVRAFNHDAGSPSSDTVLFHDFPPPPHETHGVITGKITDDSTGLPVREATVRFFGANGLWRANTHTDTGGVYWAPLDTGRYLVRAERAGYVPEWFDNVHELGSATVVPVHRDTTTADFGLRPLPVPVPITISGVVRDSGTGLPLANALVVYMRPFAAERALEHELDIFGGFELERFELPGFGRLHGMVWSGVTDSAGQYVAHLHANKRYVAMAFKPGYLHKFYHDKHTPFDADRISSSSDISGVDFDLITNPIAALYISGTVHDTTNSGVLSHVMLIRLSGIGPRVVRYRTTDSLGNYLFTNLVPGVFLVKAVPVDLYAPAWYAAVGCGIRNWRNADTIRLAGNRSDIDICVLPARDGGCGHIAGHVDHPGNLDAVSNAQGVTVYAVSTTTNQIAGYDVTEDNGSFSIDNLPPDTYSLEVDKEGYSASPTSSVTVGISNNFDVSNASIIITPDVVTSVPNHASSRPLEYRLDQNYPNPFNPSTTIEFALAKISAVSLKVYNIIGQEVASLTNSTLDAGSYKIQWNGADQSGKSLGSGIYFVKLSASPTDGNGSKFVQTRKVLLMK